MLILGLGTDLVRTKHDRDLMCMQGKNIRF